MLNMDCVRLCAKVLSTVEEEEKKYEEKEY